MTNTFVLHKNYVADVELDLSACLLVFDIHSDVKMNRLETEIALKKMLLWYFAKYYCNGCDKCNSCLFSFAEFKTCQY